MQAGSAEHVMFSGQAPHALHTSTTCACAVGKHHMRCAQAPHAHVQWTSTACANFVPLQVGHLSPLEVPVLRMMKAWFGLGSALVFLVLPICVIKGFAYYRRLKCSSPPYPLTYLWGLQALNNQRCRQVHLIICNFFLFENKSVQTRGSKIQCQTQTIV